jgi:hypothetical protein
VSSERDRSQRRLETPAELAALLGGLRARAGVRDLAEVDLDALFGVETTIAFHFADDMLAVFAARVPRLDALGVKVGEVIGHCGRLRDLGARGDLIGVAATDSEMWAIDKRHASHAFTRLVAVTRSGTGETIELLEFVRRHAGDDEPGAEPLTAALHRKPPMAEAGGRRVRHAKFGLGRAFSESGVGPNRKVTCDFPGLGLKTIQARFLEFLD